MSKLVFLFVCVVLYQTAAALKCYHCEKEACTKDVSTWEAKGCGATADPYESLCLTHTYKNATDKKEYTSRKCVLRKKNEAFKCPTDVGEQVVCEVCTSDLCNKNSAGTINFSLAAVSGVLLALFAPKLYL